MPQPCRHSPAVTALPPQPCRHSLAVTALPPQPCRHSLAATAWPPQPCRHSLAVTALPPQPCRHSPDTAPARIWLTLSPWPMCPGSDPAGSRSRLCVHALWASTTRLDPTTTSGRPARSLLPCCRYPLSWRPARSLLPCCRYPLAWRPARSLLPCCRYILAWRPSGDRSDRTNAPPAPLPPRRHEYSANDDFEKAMACYRSAMRIDERHYNAWYGLGNIYFRQVGPAPPPAPPTSPRLTASCGAPSSNAR